MKPMTPAEFKAARERIGFTQQQLAARFDVSYVTVCRWETGVTPISIMATQAMKYLVLIDDWCSSELEKDNSTDF